MDNQKKPTDISKDLAFRIGKGLIFGLLAYLPLYFITGILQPLGSYLPGYASSANIFATIWVIFLIGGILASNTIYQYIIGITRNLVTIIFFIYALNNGVISFTLPSIEFEARIVLDVKIILAMLVLVCLIGVGKEVIHALEFTIEKTENQEP